MSVLSVAERIHHMPETPESGTRTVRIAEVLAKKLQTISALKDEMGEKFKPVVFLNALLSGPIEELYAATTKAHAEFQARQAKGKKKP